MPISSDFPTDPSALVHPSLRWYPGSKADENEVGNLIPPLVKAIREHVHDWRELNYPGISETSRALLEFWFSHEHVLPTSNGPSKFQYYFAQREAVETTIWLFENQRARSAIDLLRYSSNDALSLAMFEENWTRYVLKLATGVGKTKVLSLLVAWSYFHRKYELDSPLAKDFLVIAPNIIVLDRLREDFSGLSIFYNDPVIPPNSYSGRNWREDFAPSLHVQDEIGSISPNGNIFLTNIHRVYQAKSENAGEKVDLFDYFLGDRPKKGKSSTRKGLSEALEGLDELMVLNDEAHHIHDNSLAWFQAIEKLDADLRFRNKGKGLSLQIDLTATPKKSNGAIFPQTVCSFPLVEAIRQGIVKAPVLPDSKSRASLTEYPSDKVTEKFADHIKLGVLEWSQYRDKLSATGKNPILFIMTTTTAEADEVAEHLQRSYPDFRGKTLVIHTNGNGEISEAPTKAAELTYLRFASKNLDSPDSQYLAVVSVLMLREGWDVSNVVSMVGLRPYNSDSKILPEQTLGRGLRRMFRGDETIREHVSVVGTPAFLEFVEQIQLEGVELDYVPMGDDAEYRGPLVIEVDRGSNSKPLANLEIELPQLSRRISKERKNLEELDVDKIVFTPIAYRTFAASEMKEILFEDLDTGLIVWKTDLNKSFTPTSQAVIGFIVEGITSQLRLVGQKDILYGKVKDFIARRLFGSTVDLDSTETLLNLAEADVRRLLTTIFVDAVNSLIIADSGVTRVVSSVRVTETKPFVVKNQDFVLSSKTIFNRVIGDSRLELDFATRLDHWFDVEAFFKNMFAINFKIEYVNSRGELSNYYPDFVVRNSAGQIYIVELKGREDLDTAPKWKRLRQWCDDATETDINEREFIPLFVGQETFEKYGKELQSFEQFCRVLANDKPEQADR